MEWRRFVTYLWNDPRISKIFTIIVTFNRWPKWSIYAYPVGVSCHRE